MRKALPVLAVCLIALACCVEREEIIGEKSREGILEKHKNLINEVIIDPGKTVSLSKIVTEPSDFVINYAGSANLRFTAKQPNGEIEEINHTRGYLLDLGQGAYTSNLHWYIRGTGPFEFSVTNADKRPAYLWYNFYIIPRNTPDEKIKEYNMGNSTEVEYLILS